MLHSTKRTLYDNIVWHPAIRLIETSSQLDLKAMVYNVMLNGKWYKVTYFVSPPEDFPRYLQAAHCLCMCKQCLCVHCWIAMLWLSGQVYDIDSQNNYWEISECKKDPNS
jgi:hypothetical protein